VVVTPKVFVITVAGAMDARLRAHFDDVDVTVEHSLTRLRVICPDSSVLHGIVRRIEVLDLELLDLQPGDPGAR
jgi:hypothetical protein